MLLENEPAYVWVSGLITSGRQAWLLGGAGRVLHFF